MPHLRKRHVGALVKKSMSYSPIVAVFGHRQVGKTTLVSSFAENYRTLDLETALVEAQTDPMPFLMRHQGRPLAIDECQLAPKLFPAMKEWVRTNKCPGQLLLTGSVRFSSRKAIRESLTGRVIAWELLPMDLSEIHERPLPMSIPRILGSKSIHLNLVGSGSFTHRAFERYCLQGGLPGMFAIRDEALLHQRFETQLNTLLERDLKLIVQTSLEFRQLRELLVFLSSQIGEPLQLETVRRQVRISVPTLRRLLAALEAMFLLRIIPTEGSEKKPVIFFEDMGEANHLASFSARPLARWTSFLFENIRPQIAYRPEKAIEMFQYRNRGGAWVPLCFRSKNLHLGLIPLLNETPDISALKSAKSFIDAYSHSKVMLVHPSAEGRDEVLDTQIRLIPASKLL